MTNAEIAERLRNEKPTIQALCYALRLMLPQSSSAIEADEHRICEWINDACEALSRIPQETKND